MTSTSTRTTPPWRPAAVGLLAAALVAPTASASAAVVDLQPQRLDRGPDIAVAHIEDDTTFVDGDLRVELPGDRATLVGPAGRAWLASTSREDDTGHRLLRVRPDGTTKLLRRGVPGWDMDVSEDGREVVAIGNGTRQRTRVRVFSTRSGKVKAVRAFPDWPTSLGMKGRRVLLSRWDQGVTWWNTRTGTVRRVLRKPVNIADIGNDLLAYYTGDPFLDGCVRLARLSAPRRILWRSCEERITAFSPDGRRMATIDLLADGLGPRRVWERKVRGRLLGEYTTSWFGAVSFEGPKDLLLEVNGRRKAATVRCRAGECENATDPVEVQMPRQDAPAG